MPAAIRFLINSDRATYTMPLGLERINARRKQPNDRINFIKPLKGPEEAFSQDYLERIAAICNPIMKSNYLTVMSLEEYPYNTVFLGRNFNAGEVIQLVLRSRSGHWLPFKFVQMVMMHELAHCKQMNHSKAFWTVKNQYADELKVLWSTGYTGEDMWSRGRSLLTGLYDDSGLGADEILPEHLCGGTFRSSGKRKRSTKPKLSWKEQRERRISKKFGTNGTALGADDAIKSELEKGKKPVGKPRVAGSNRGRELRVAAALARFETKKEEVKDEVNNDEDVSTDSGNETESNWENDPKIKTEPPGLDVDGTKLRDSNGREMIRVCDDEEDEHENVKNEMSELSELRIIKKEPGVSDMESESAFAVAEAPKKSTARKLLKTAEAPATGPIAPTTRATDVSQPKAKTVEPKLQEPAEEPAEGSEPGSEPGSNKAPTGQWSGPTPASDVLACPICSVENDLDAATCMVCANVLDAKKVSGTWKCQNEACRGGRYLNANDYGVCGVCGGCAPCGT